MKTGSTTRRQAGADEILHSNQSDARRIEKNPSNVSRHGSFIFSLSFVFSFRAVSQRGIARGLPQCSPGFRLKISQHFGSFVNVSSKLSVI